MSSRLIHILVPEDQALRALAMVEPRALRHWRCPTQDGGIALSAVLPGRSVERVIDDLELAFLDEARFAVVVTPVDAFVPSGRALVSPWTERPPTRLEAFLSRDRLSTEELYDDIEDGTHLTRTYLLFVVTSAIIAALGMRSGQTAVVIGAMVIAPLLSPSMALALAATVGDRALALRALGVTVAGALVAFGATALVGTLIAVDPTVPELALRTQMTKADLVLALASGVAGVLAFSRGLSASLVGVMIAVALVPPLAAAGLLVGAGYGHLAANAVLLFLSNFVGINVAGIATFLFQGLPPKDWRLTGGLFAVWTVLLAALALLIAIRFGV